MKTVAIIACCALFVAAASADDVPPRLDHLFRAPVAAPAPPASAPSAPQPAPPSSATPPAASGYVIAPNGRDTRWSPLQRTP
jgi:hypothetical protein